MLPRKNRLSLRSEFSALKNKGKQVQGELFSLLFVVEGSQKQTPARLAFVVSNKIHPKATQRNHVRRLLAEAVYLLVDQLKTDTKAVLLTKHRVLNANLEEIKLETKQLFQKADLFKQANHE